MTHVGEVSPEDATRILNAVSDYHRQTVTATQPILECELPLDGSRFEGLIPPLVANPSFVIRKKATRVFTFDDYIKAGTLSTDAANVLRQLIVDKRNILVAGALAQEKPPSAMPCCIKSPWWHRTSVWSSLKTPTSCNAARKIM
ncbi:ATPase, T2SS/T4P/T4SS family [Vibrio parahaemolyticus]|nr:ATPase, T2SS/T4P/T4SS family [Vibrio parahaemolyticus]